MHFSEFVFTYAMDVVFPLFIMAIAWIASYLVAQCMHQTCPILCMGLLLNACLLLGIVVGLLAGCMLIGAIHDLRVFDGVLQWVNERIKLAFIH